MNRPTAGRQDYIKLFEMPLAICIYLLSFVSKAIMWMQPTFSQANWRYLLIVNVVEAAAWIIWMLRRHGKQLAFVFLPLPLVCALYSSVSVALLAAGMDIYPFPDFAVREGMLLQSLFATHLWILTGLFFSRKGTGLFRTKVTDWVNGATVSSVGLFLFLIVGLVVAVLYVANFYASGAASLLQTSGDRALILDTLETGKAWLLTAAFVAWLMACAILWLSPKARLLIKYTHTWSAVVIVVVFFSTYSRLGNRRELMIGVIFICLLLLFKGRTKLIAIVLAVAIAGGLYVGIARSSDSYTRSEMDAATFYLNLFGEAILPNYPLLDHVSSRHELWLGSSYLRLPGYISPSFGLWKKPESLSETFAKQYADGAMGYAYTPLGEGYANFGIVSAFLIPLLLVLSQRMLLQGALVTGRLAGVYLPAVLTFLSLPLDINRGEFVSIAFEIVLYSFLVWFYLWLCAMRFKGQV